MPTLMRSKSVHNFVITVISGIIVSLAAFALSSKMEKHHQQQITDEYARYFTSLVELNFEQIISDLRFMAEFFYASDVVTQSEFEGFSKNYFIHPGIIYLGWHATTSGNTSQPLESWKNYHSKNAISIKNLFENTPLTPLLEKRPPPGDKSITAIPIINDKDTSPDRRPLIAVTLPLTSSNNRVESQEGNIIALLDLTALLESIMQNPENRNIAQVQIANNPSPPFITLGKPWASSSPSELPLHLQNITWTITIQQNQRLKNNFLPLFPGMIFFMGILITVITAAMIYPQDILSRYRI